MGNHARDWREFAAGMRARASRSQPYILDDVCPGGCDGGNGSNTGGVVYSAEVNGRAYNNGPVVNNDLGNLVVFGAVSVGAACLLPVALPAVGVPAGVGAVVSRGLDVFDIAHWAYEELQLLRGTA